PTPTALPQQATPPPAATPDATQAPQPVQQTALDAPDDDDRGGGSPWLLVGAAIGAVLVLGAGAWWFLLRFTALEPRALFATMVRWGRAGGVSGDAHMTPREYARRVARRYPDLAGDASRIVDVYEEQ